MDRTNDITESFRSRQINLVGPVLRDRENAGHLAFVSIENNDAGEQVPTNFALSKAKREVELEFGKITIVLVRRGDEDVTSSIKSMMFRRFSVDVRNVFSRVTGQSVSVWVETKSATTKEKSDEMADSVSGLVRQFGLELQDFINTSELNLPSETACIQVIRKRAPVALAEVVVELDSRGFRVPGDNWVARILDRWRKKRLIHRKNDGRFVMTVSGLSALGSGKNRRSPDVSRALDLARRQN